MDLLGIYLSFIFTKNIKYINLYNKKCSLLICVCCNYILTVYCYLLSLFSNILQYKNY